MLPIPSATSSEFSRKIWKWAIVTVLFAVMPIGFDLLFLVFERQSISWQALFSDPSTYLIGFGIAASGFGEAVFNKRHTGQSPVGYIIAIVFSMLTMAIGTAMYASAKIIAKDIPPPFWIPVCYGLVAVVVSLAAVWTSES